LKRLGKEMSGSESGVVGDCGDSGAVETPPSGDGTPPAAALDPEGPGGVLAIDG
jgi:hypothetical protein